MELPQWRKKFLGLLINLWHTIFESAVFESVIQSPPDKRKIRKWMCTAGAYSQYITNNLASHNLVQNFFDASQDQNLKLFSSKSKLVLYSLISLRCNGWPHRMVFMTFHNLTDIIWRINLANYYKRGWSKIAPAELGLWITHSLNARLLNFMFS